MGFEVKELRSVCGFLIQGGGQSSLFIEVDGDVQEVNGCVGDVEVKFDGGMEVINVCEEAVQGRSSV